MKLVFISFLLIFFFIGPSRETSLSNITISPVKSDPPSPEPLKIEPKEKSIILEKASSTPPVVKSARAARNSRRKLEIAEQTPQKIDTPKVPQKKSTKTAQKVKVEVSSVEPRSTRKRGFTKTEKVMETSTVLTPKIPKKSENEGNLRKKILADWSDIEESDGDQGSA